MGLLISFFLAVVFLLYVRDYQKRKEAAADEEFRMIILSLEEKAKREGTFEVSFFDKESK